MENSIRISGIQEESIVDGPGIRYVVFTQGCPHHCAGCHNPETHCFEGGREETVEAIMAQIRKNPLVSGVTLSGGEPMVQAAQLIPLAEQAKAAGKHLMVYSGYTFEELCTMQDAAVTKLLHLCDLLVDGRFEQEQKSLEIRFRGSKNQRIIDLPQTFATGGHRRAIIRQF